MKKPAVALCNAGFAADARSAASGRGMPGLRVVPETVPSGSPWIAAMEEVEAGVSAAIDDIVAALTQPLTPEEEFPVAKAAERPSRIVFAGDLREVNRFFYRRGWGDGLPIIPPTEEAVAEMLKGTDLPPDHVVAKIIPRFGKATVEKIAVNAVMAGALPTYMPVLIAGIQAALDPRTRFNTIEVSTGSWSPFWILNGPVRRDLHVNSGSGALSPGDIANATIGRAMGLIIKNIGGVRKGVEDMGVFGNPGKYTMVIAENEEESPWEPLHVQQGFKKEDCTVSVFFPNTFSHIPMYASDDRGIMNTVISNILPGRRGLFCLLLNPGRAKTLASSGWTKKDIAGFISEYARVPAHRHSHYRPTKETQRAALWQRPPHHPQDSMAILNSPDWIRVVVAGGPSGNLGLVQGGSAERGNEWVTKKVELPADWDKLVEKYSNLVPRYVQY
ncbi:MAG: hypothetical protein HY675_24200 [Chloroflexi bacterium]|nr:hypothetical protein [Chloroflexota bacterium]